MFVESNFLDSFSPVIRTKKFYSFFILLWHMTGLFWWILHWHTEPSCFVCQSNRCIKDVRHLLSYFVQSLKNLPMKNCCFDQNPNIKFIVYALPPVILRGRLLTIVCGFVRSRIGKYRIRRSKICRCVCRIEQKFCKKMKLLQALLFLFVSLSSVKLEFSIEQKDTLPQTTHIRSHLTFFF